MATSPPVGVQLVDLLKDSTNVVFEAPSRIVRLEPSVVTDPPDVVADPALLTVGPLDLLAGDLLAHADRLEHGGVAEPSSADVVDLGDARLAKELVEGMDEIEAVDGVTNLLALVTEHGVRRSRYGTPHHVREE